jgi:hypothetical protein
MCKKTKHKYHSTQAQWRQAHNQAEQGLKVVENRTKPKSKHLNCVGHHHGPGPDDHRRQPNEDGLIWAHWWCGRTLGGAAPQLALFRAKLCGPPLTTSLMPILMVRRCN